MFSDPNVRKWAYVAQSVIGAVLLVLVASGVVSQELGASIGTAITSVLGVVLLGGGELARRHVNQAPSIAPDDVQVIADALAKHAQAAVGEGAAAAVEQARRDLENLLGR